MASKEQTTMTLFTEESMKNNKTGKKYRMNCKVSGDMIEYDRGDAGWKHMIRLNVLKEVELHEKITINKHKYENIICLKADKDVKFLKAENRDEMNEWYRLLMKILTKFGWIDAEPECTIEGKKRRSTNPEGMKRRQRETKSKSALVSMEDSFIPHESAQTESQESSTDSSSDDSPINSITDDTDYPLYEESIITERQQQVMNVKQSQKSSTPPKPPVRIESIKPKVPVESDETQYTDLLPRNTPPQVPTSSTATNGITHNQTSKKDIKSNLERLFKDRLPSTENAYVAHHPKPEAKPEGISSCNKIIENSTTKELQENVIYENGEVNRRKSSLHNLHSKPKPPIKRKPSLPCKPVGQGGGGGGGSCKPAVQGGGDREVTQPQLPKRDGQALVTSIEKFRQFQDKESIIVPLNKKVVAGGRRLSLVKVPGLGYLWICRWDLKGNPLEEILHPGDQILTINGIDLENSDASFAYGLMELVKDGEIKLNINRAPYARVFHLKRTADNRDIGIQLNGNVIERVDTNGLFWQAGSTRGKTRSVLGRPGELVEWAITEINMQPVNFNATSEQVNNLLEKADPDVALVIQPADLIQAMKTALCGRGCCCHN